MRLLVFLLRWGFPVLVITDLSSQLYSSSLILNISRAIRMLILILFIIENVRHLIIILKFKFFKFFILFNIILFAYVFTDRNFMEGFWLYSKILFWTMGLNVLFAYDYLGIFNLKDFIEVSKKVVLVAFVFTILFFTSGFIKDDYNIAAYLVLFIYPIILFSSKGYKYNKFYILISVLSILITLKRGAVLALVLGSIIYYLGSLRYSFNIKRLFAGIFLSVFLIFSGYFIYKLQEDTIADRFSQEQFDVNNDKAGSGRVGMYKQLYFAWANSDNRFFGFGNQADTYRRANKRIHAHSDILGFLYNHGYVGVGLILMLYIKIFLFHRYYKKINKQLSYIIPTIFVILFLVNLYSGLLRSTDALYIFGLIPYLQLNRFEFA